MQKTINQTIRDNIVQILAGGEDLTGHDLFKELQARKISIPNRTNAKTPSKVYTALNKLAKDGLVQKIKEGRGNIPSTYTLIPDTGTESSTPVVEEDKKSITGTVFRASGNFTKNGFQLNVYVPQKGLDLLFSKAREKGISLQLPG